MNACLGEACATVNEVNNQDEMLTAEISAVSEKAKKLGIKVVIPGA